MEVFLWSVKIRCLGKSSLSKEDVRYLKCKGCLTVCIVVCIMSLCIFGCTSRGNDNNENDSQAVGNNVGYDIEKEADRDIVMADEKKKLSKDELSEIKGMQAEKQEVTVGDLSLTDDNYVHQANEVAENGFTLNEDNEVITDLGWSSGELSGDDLLKARNVAAKLYENKLNKGANSNRYVVRAGMTSAEDLNSFAIPVFYYVSKDGLLTLQMRLSVYDLNEETSQDLLIPITVAYKEDHVEIIE